MLDQAAVLKQPCDLDLAVFFARHPRSLLSSESLAALLGYEIKQVAQSLDVLLAAGILRRRQTSAHAARLYEMTSEDLPGGDWVESLLALSSTRQGRLALLNELDRRSQRESGAARSRLDTAARPGPRRIDSR